MKSEKKLQQYNEHLAYELWMLYATARELLTPDMPCTIESGAETTGVTTTQTTWSLTIFSNSAMLSMPVVRNALVESFAIHVRALYDFVKPIPRPRNDDITALDYLEEDSDWRNVQDQLVRDLSQIRTDIHKNVAHLTSKRVERIASGKEWPVQKIVTDLGEALAEFVERAPKERLSDDIIECVARIRALASSAD